MTTVEFVDRKGSPIGTVTVTDSGELHADPWLQSVVDTWTANDRTPAEFAAFYDGWSNGHVTAHVTQPPRGTPVAASLGSGARFRALQRKSED